MGIAVESDSIVVFEEKYTELIPSEIVHTKDNFSMTLVSQLIKEKYHFSDDKVVYEIAMNPYLQYFLGLPKKRQTVPFDSSMMKHFWQRLTPELMSEVNNVIIG